MDLRLKNYQLPNQTDLIMKIRIWYTNNYFRMFLKRTAFVSAFQIFLSYVQHLAEFERSILSHTHKKSIASKVGNFFFTCISCFNKELSKYLKKHIMKKKNFRAFVIFFKILLSFSIESKDRSDHNPEPANKKYRKPYHSTINFTESEQKDQFHNRIFIPVYADSNNHIFFLETSHGNYCRYEISTLEKRLQL